MMQLKSKGRSVRVKSTSRQFSQNQVTQEMVQLKSNHQEGSSAIVWSATRLYSWSQFIWFSCILLKQKYKLNYKKEGKSTQKQPNCKKRCSPCKKGSMKKVVKSKVAAQKWLWWSDNGKNFNYISDNLFCLFQLGIGTKIHLKCCY